MQVSIVEVSPRDGLQNDPSDPPTAVKVELITRAIAAGARRVEVASFVSPKAVPKMADAEAVLEGLRSQGDLGASLIGLVVNERGVRRAAAAGVDEVNAVVVATDSFSRANQSMTTAQCLDSLSDLVGAAHDAGLPISVTISAAFGCAFEGEVPLGRVLDVAAAVAEAGPDEIALADTIGAAVPADVTARVSAVRPVVGGVALRAHFHDTRNTGVANAFAAFEAGITTLDASLGGTGGCPFSPGATGNVATEDLVYLFERSGVDTGLSLVDLIVTSRWLAGELGHPLPGMLSRAGPFPG
jgi:hydroxymethylglutaryl-CoA lyase